YQPQFDANSGALLGAEALLRWTDQDEVIRPDVFIHVAEESGLIDPLGKLVMHQSLQQLKQWLPLLPPGFRLSVNLSPRQFRASAVDMDWLAAIGQYGVPCASLSLEVTESVLLDPDGTALAALARLRQAGIEIALDDFGTGYSSLSYLRVLAFDVLKIDKSFVMGLSEHGSADKPDRSTAVVDATLAMAHKLGYRVVAEGVETQAQHHWLRQQGCDVVQGFLFSQALPPHEFATRWLPQA
ncbi:MAG: EAL domain-containing protein, partial [Burkholderiales bacterium]|nr:EAL domain-containing protein [Burkholderiales bacterium]